MTYFTHYYFGPIATDVIEGTNIITAEFMDGAGNISSASNTIVCDFTSPVGTIDTTPKTLTNNRNIVLNLTATDPLPSNVDKNSEVKYMRFRELQDGVVKTDWTNSINFSTTYNWTLSAGSGIKKIEVEYFDSALNVSTVKSVLINYQDLKFNSVLFTNIINPPAGNPTLPTSELVKIKKGYEFTVTVSTVGSPDTATYTFNGKTGNLVKTAENLYTINLKVDMYDSIEQGTTLPVILTITKLGSITQTATLNVVITGNAAGDTTVNITN